MATASPDKALSDEKLEQITPQDDGHVKYLEVTNADLALALSTGPQLKASSPQSLQLFLILLVAFMGSLSNGFDGSGPFFFFKSQICRICIIALTCPCPPLQS